MTQAQVLKLLDTRKWVTKNTMNTYEIVLQSDSGMWDIKWCIYDSQYAYKTNSKQSVIIIDYGEINVDLINVAKSKKRWHRMSSYPVIDRTNPIVAKMIAIRDNINNAAIERAEKKKSERINVILEQECLL